MRVVVRQVAALVLLTGALLGSSASPAVPVAGSAHHARAATPERSVAPTPHRYRGDGSGLRMGLHCRMVPALS